MNTLKEKANGAKIVAPATDSKATAKNETSKNEAIKPILETKAEKRVKSLDLFQSLCKKFNFLKNKSDSLNSYLHSRDGLKETIIIENAEGEIFEISNSRIIGKILVVCQEELFEILEQTEKEVVEFVI